MRSPLFPALSRMRRFGDNISVECQALLPRAPAASIEGAGLKCCSVARLKRCATVAPPFGRGILSRAHQKTKWEDEAAWMVEVS